MSASASDLSIKPPTTLLEAIDELNRLRDEWQARVKFAASVLEQQKESLLQSTTLTDENRESAVLVDECRALQLELERKKSAALADENRTLRLELEREKKANAICKTQDEENKEIEEKAGRYLECAEMYMKQFETAMTKLTQAEEIIEGVASWSSLMRRESMDEQKSQLSRPTYGGMDYSPDYPEIVLRDKDYIWTESSLTPGDHSFIFSCGRPLEDIMLEHKVTKTGFRLYIINHMGHSVYYGVYTVLSWPSKAMTGPEFLKLSEETRNTIAKKAAVGS
ncbi:hypothetical protein EWM64_g3013 [Hericium alpestre]|uniref:Uncharacterized protein n=1 Tax=Hericium alpestre TaxID=135208 RepID=A0A4Z0A3H4_9AGAM|nr:hypothetical protein EWM64_g3013 [Hericium alpestre]